MTSSPSQKLCLYCTAPLIRSHKTRPTAWEGRRFCGSACSNKFNHQRSGRAVVVVPTGQTSEATASANLLRSLIKFGIKHNIDLGMGRDAFFARARECGFDVVVAS